MCGVGEYLWDGCGCVGWVSIFGMGVDVWGECGCVRWVWMFVVGVEVWGECACMGWGGYASHVSVYAFVIV